MQGEVREVERIPFHLSDMLGEKRANYTQIMQDIDSELSTVCTAQRNISLVKSGKTPWTQRCYLRPRNCFRTWFD